MRRSPPLGLVGRADLLLRLLQLGAARLRALGAREGRLHAIARRLGLGPGGLRRGLGLELPGALDVEFGSGPVAFLGRAPRLVEGGAGLLGIARAGLRPVERRLDLEERLPLPVQLGLEAVGALTGRLLLDLERGEPPFLLGEERVPLGDAGEGVRDLDVPRDERVLPLGDGPAQRRHLALQGLRDGGGRPAGLVGARRRGAGEGGVGERARRQGHEREAREAARRLAADGEVVGGLGRPGQAAVHGDLRLAALAAGREHVAHHGRLRGHLHHLELGGERSDEALVARDVVRPRGRRPGEGEEPGRSRRGKRGDEQAAGREERLQRGDALRARGERRAVRDHDEVERPAR